MRPKNSPGDDTPTETPKKRWQRNLQPAWKPGQSGNPAGRPKGSRNQLATDFVADLCDAWQAKGAAAIAKTAETEPATFVKVVASLMPKQFKVEHEHNMNTERLQNAIRVVSAAPVTLNHGSRARGAAAKGGL
jgi:hypothetical protein